MGAYQMLSLSATAIHGVKGWNLTTEGTPGFLLRKIWSSNLVMPARETHGGSRAGTMQASGVPGQGWCQTGAGTARAMGRM